MTLKTEIIEKCKTEKSRGVLLSQLALIERGVKENNVLERVNGDPDLAIKTQLHWELHDLNSGGNKTMAVEHIAGLVGLILMTRAWEGYLTGTGVSSSQSFKAFLKDNGLDLEHVQYCLDKAAREFVLDFSEACVFTQEESINKAAAIRAGRATTGDEAPGDYADKGGDRRRRIRQLARNAETDPTAKTAYERYLSGEQTLTASLRQAGIRPSDLRNKASSISNKLCPDAKVLRECVGLKPEMFLQFALNYVVDQFKDGIPPDLLAKYVQEAPTK